VPLIENGLHLLLEVTLKCALELGDLALDPVGFRDADDLRREHRPG
jgi:hypothetical protein